MRIIACSDIHIGRIPAVPSQAGLFGKSSWNALVQKAIDLQVDALVLAGDVVERDNAWFEAYGALTKGLERLQEEGIAVFGVAGNHDSQVFARLAKHNQAIHLLGLNGRWEHVDYQGVRFLGWSFPDVHHPKDPLADFPAEYTHHDGPKLGILHCDLDASGTSSQYAPTRSHSLENSGIPLWVLGHIHAGGLKAQGHALYCGSPYALDAAETGPHGIWLLENQAGNQWKTPEFIQLSPWRFESCIVELDTKTTSLGLPEAITKSLRRQAETFFSQGFVGKIYCRLVFTGTISPELDLSRALPKEELGKLEVSFGETAIHALDDFINHTQVEVDLIGLARGVGPMAMLAKQLLDTDTLPGLLREIKEIDSNSYNHTTFRPLLSSTEQENPGYEEIARQAGVALLRAMLNQSQQKKES
jgi:DNA repair protein SbcD/Mre11